MGKKSKRPNRFKNKDAAIAPAPVIANLGCLHGASLLEHNPVAQAQEDCLQSMIATLPQTLVDGGSFSSGVAAALENMDSIGIMNQHMFQRTVAEGVKRQLSQSQKQRNLASLCVHLAIIMHYWLKVGGAEFLLVLRTQDVKMRRNYPWFG